MTRMIGTARRSLRRLYQEQLHLQQRHVARHDVSGLDARAARRTLRWSQQGALIGELLPEADSPRQPPSA